MTVAVTTHTAMKARRRDRLRDACALLVLAALFVWPSPAGALEGKPLRITKFTIQPTAATVQEPVEIEGRARGFRVVNEPYSSPFTQAGGRPWALTTAGEFETEAHEEGVEIDQDVTREPKDIVVSLPPGLLGDPMALPHCSLPAEVEPPSQECPPDTQVGVYQLGWQGTVRELGPIVNVAPEKGQSAEFALVTPVPFDTAILTAHLIRTAEGYSFEIASNGIPEVGLHSFELTFWGVPADPSHDPLRGAVCSGLEPEFGFECQRHAGGETSQSPMVPFLTMPSSCSSGPETATVRADSWEEPGTVSEGRYSGYTEAQTTLPAATGCNALQFNAGTGLGIEPDTTLADAPVGLGVNLDVPQSEGPQQNATPLLRQTKITLPEGMSVSPGVVDGIKACNATGPEGIDIGGPESEEVAPNGELHLAAGHCPDASIVGEAEAITPFLPTPVKGHVYLARPGCGGESQAACTPQDAADGNLYRLYLELGGAGAFGEAGIVFKVPLETEANPATGQLTAIASNLVQAPYSEVKIRLNGGPRAPLDNPPACGQAVATADLTPWSAAGLTPEGSLVAGTPDSLSSSFFDVEGCASPTPFSPGFTAGTVSPQAGQFSPFTMTLTRQDREQYVKGVQIHTPPGLLAMLSSVPLCPEAQADDPAAYGECAASKIGTTRVASGAGSHPFEIEGDVYLTGPHDGAPFGLSIVTHVVAGPFNLGLVVVRARIDIDPENSTATITTDETGPYALPQIVFGVPLRLKRITVDIDRPGFMFNPTNCGAQQVTANISGNQNTTAGVSSAFAAGGCKSLAFQPQFKVSTSGRTSRLNGASLDAKVSYPSGSMGTQANISYVKVELPKQLPSRLSTLQHACLASVFDSSPAACPAASVVGIVRASTPVLPVALQGPAYFVSHGSEAFPSLVVVLQGDGVRVDLTGTTFISEAGITSSTFKTVPDVPIESFELYLPEGPHSALGANTNLCNVKTTTTVRRKVTVHVRGRTVHRLVKRRVSKPASLLMPTEFVAQNGAVVKQQTKIDVTGCAAARAAKSARGARRAQAAGHNSDRRNGR